MGMNCKAVCITDRTDDQPQTTNLHHDAQPVSGTFPVALTIPPPKEKKIKKKKKIISGTQSRNQYYAEAHMYFLTPVWLYTVNNI